MLFAKAKSYRTSSLFTITFKKSLCGGRKVKSEEVKNILETSSRNFLVAGTGVARLRTELWRGLTVPRTVIQHAPFDSYHNSKTKNSHLTMTVFHFWLRGQESNLRPPGYEGFQRKFRENAKSSHTSLFTLNYNTFRTFSKSTPLLIRPVSTTSRRGQIGVRILRKNN